MLNSSGAIRKTYTILIRKLILEHDISFIGISKNYGDQITTKAKFECSLTQQISVTVYEEANTNDSTINLHIFNKIGQEDVQLGTVTFECKKQKILNPLSKQTLSKQLNNKNGYIQYKFIKVQSKNVSQQQVRNGIKIKNNLALRIGKNGIDKQQLDSLVVLLGEKDEVIAKMDLEIQKLIKETKKLHKSLSKEKQQAGKLEKNISLNVKLNASRNVLEKNSKSKANLWERERQQYEFEIEKLNRKIQNFENRERQLISQNQMLRKKNESEIRNNQRKISDLRKQIEERYESEMAKSNLKSSQLKSSGGQGDLAEREKKNRYIEQQLAQQIRKIEIQKERQKVRGDVENELRLQLEKQIQKQKQRERQRQRQRERQRERQMERMRQKQRERERSKTYLRQSSIDNRQLMKQIHELEDQKYKLREKLDIKDVQMHEIVVKLERAQKQIGKLQDENIELRKTKSKLLKQAQGMAFKQEADSLKKISLPLEAYEKMILQERKQINDQKLRAEIDELRYKMKKDEKQYKQKLQEKQMEIMKIKLSQKSATRERQIYSARIKQMMDSVQGDKKKFLQALERSNRLEITQARSNQLQLKNNELEAANYKIAKQKQELQNTIKKLKAKIEERESQWVKLKSIESQYEYYRTQCEKFEKAFRKFEQQYSDVRSYCHNLEVIVGKKPKRGPNEEVNNQIQQEYKSNIRDKLQYLTQQVRDMQNKFYYQQVQIWLTQRTNVIQYYAKKLQQDKARIMQLQVNEQSKQTLIAQKQKQILQLKDQQINDIDRKVAKLKHMVKQDQKQITNNMIDKQFIQQTLQKLEEKIGKLKEDQEKRKNQNNILREKNEKLQNQIKEKIASIKKNMEDENSGTLTQKKSLSLLHDDREVIKLEDMRKSYLEQFKKSRDFFMNKPFEELKKLNAELQSEKRKVQTELNSLRFNFDKERVQLNDKIRTKEREVKKLQHEAATNQKINAKNLSEIEVHKKGKQELEKMIRILREELKQVSKTLEVKEKQCSEALGEIKKMGKNLQEYEEAEKRMFEDVKRMKEKLEKKQQEMEAILQERNQKSKQLDAERIIQINKLQQKIKDLENKLEREISQNLSIKTQNEKLAQNITQYDIKMKEKQQEYNALDQAFTIYKTQWGQKVQEYQSQNSILQNNILQIADEISNKQAECNELQIKLQYAQKRQDTLKGLKDQLEQANKVLKKQYEELRKEMDNQYEKFKDQVRAFDAVKQKIATHSQENLKLQQALQEKEEKIRQKQEEVHLRQLEIVRAEGQIKTLQTKIEYLEERIHQQAKKIQTLEIERQIVIQKQTEERRKLTEDRDREDRNRSRKSSEGEIAGPNSPVPPKKIGAMNLPKSTSLIQQSSTVFQKSSKNLNSSSVIKKSSLKDKQQEENEQLIYSKQGIELNVLRPVQQTADDLKATLAMPKKEIAQNDSSKVDIDVLQSDQQNPKRISIAKSESILKSKDLIPMKVPDLNEKQPSNIERSFGMGQSEDEVSHQQIHQHEYEEEEIHHLHERIGELEHIIQEITQERNGYFEELKNWKKMYENESSSQIYIPKVQQAKNELNIDKSIVPQIESSKKTQLRRTPSQRSPSDSNVENVEKSNKKIEIYEKQIEELRKKITDYELIITQAQNHNKQLEDERAAQEEDREKLISQLQDLMSKLEDDRKYSKKLQTQIKTKERVYDEKYIQLQKRIQEMVIQDMKKDETITETMKIVDELNQEIKSKDAITSSLNTQVLKLRQNLERSNKILQNNKIEYRKYEETAELQILRLKESTDELNSELSTKSMQVNELAQRYIHLEEQLQKYKQEIQKRDQQVLVERSKLKQAYDRRDQALEEMRKFEASKTSLMNRIGDLEIKVGEKNDELKQITKQTAITYKKYDIQIETEKQQHSLTRKKLKQRQEHITNLKMELANYNEICHNLQKQKNSLSEELSKIQRQLREIMNTYQAELNELQKDKLSLMKQLQKHTNADRQNQQRIELLNKEITKKNRQIKEITFKLEEQQGNIQKMKEKHRKQVGDLIADMEIKNDQYHKVKVQLERQTEHYFSKECQYLADKEKKEKLQSQYISKLQYYQKTVKQMQQELKQIQNRPSVDQWQQVCFENQLYKNRIQELENMLRESGEQQHEQMVIEFKRYKLSKEREIQDLSAEMQKYGAKFHNLQQSNYVLKKDNDNMKMQLRTLMQQKMKLQKTIRENEEDMRQLREEINFYKDKRVDHLNKLLNESYD